MVNAVQFSEMGIYDSLSEGENMFSISNHRSEDSWAKISSGINGVSYITFNIMVAKVYKTNMYLFAFQATHQYPRSQ
jgi:hypothetical protein